MTSLSLYSWVVKRPELELSAIIPLIDSILHRIQGQSNELGAKDLSENVLISLSLRISNPLEEADK